MDKPTQKLTLPIAFPTVLRTDVTFGVPPLQRYSLPIETQLEDFSVDNFTLVGANATKSISNGKILVSGPPATNQTVGLDKTYVGTYDPAALGTIAVAVERVSDVNETNLALSLGIGSGTPASLSQVNYANGFQFLKGVRWLASDISKFPNPAAAAPANFRLRPLFTQNNGTQYRFIKALLNAGGRPTVCLTFDDGYISQFTDVFPLMTARNLTATLFPAPSKLGTGSFYTLANLATMLSAGFALCCDSGLNDEGVSTTDGPAALAQVNAVRDYWLGQGMSPAGLNIVAWSLNNHSQVSADALTGGGYKLARTTEPQTMYTRHGIGSGQAMAMPSQGFSSTAPLTTFTDKLTEAKTDKKTAIFHFHDVPVSDTPSAIGWKYSLMVQALDALAADRDAGLVDVVTLPQLLARDGIFTG